jgi:catechol 2,3-dioxygenase-like lactoylglutathione lyase family enzyme
MAGRAQMLGSTFVLATRDLERSAAHYVDTLGFRPLAIDAPGWRFLERDACRIRIGHCPDAVPATELGDHSFFGYVEIDDVDAYSAEIAARGAIILAPPADKPWGMREMAVRTIDGHRIMFATRLRS